MVCYLLEDAPAAIGGGGVPELGGSLLGGPYKGDSAILGSMLGPLITEAPIKTCFNATGGAVK